MNDPLVTGIMYLLGLNAVLGVLWLCVLYKRSKSGVDTTSKEMKRRQLTLTEKWNKEGNDGHSN